MTQPYRTTLVTIMGDQYPIKSDADAEYLRKLAKYVEEKILFVEDETIEVVFLKVK